MEGNWAGLWRGNFVNVIKTAPENAIRLATYEKLKKLLNKNTNKNYNTFSEKLVCGSAAGFIATLILYPLKTVKTIMNLGNTGEFRSIADCINKLYVAHGLRAFYRGILANSIGKFFHNFYLYDFHTIFYKLTNKIAIIPSAGIDLATYETLKHTYSRCKNKNEPNVIEKLIMGNISSCMGNFVVYPLFFARTRLQSNRNPNETTLNLLIHVWRRDGLIGWYRGFLLHILKIGPAASISYVIFESVTKTFSLESLK
jgi:solute carrier family 25 phosphate transporter 23/24/25/41